MTLRPSGNRGVITSSTKRLQSASLTASLSPSLRPNISCTVSARLWPVGQRSPAWAPGADAGVVAQPAARPATARALQRAKTARTCGRLSSGSRPG